MLNVHNASHHAAKCTNSWEAGWQEGIQYHVVSRAESASGTSNVSCIADWASRNSAAKSCIMIMIMIHLRRSDVQSQSGRVHWLLNLVQSANTYFSKTSKAICSSESRWVWFRQRGRRTSEAKPEHCKKTMNNHKIWFSFTIISLFLYSN